MINSILAFTGYWVGIGLEAAVIAIAAVLLILMLTGVLFGKKKKKAESQPVLLLSDGAGSEEKQEPAQPAEEAKPEPEEPKQEPVEVVEEPKAKRAKTEPVEEETVAAQAEPAEPEVIYVQSDNGGVVFNESKSITELYEELSNEQKSFFDELREEALAKPDTELSITKNYISVKLGKRNLLKLVIRRGVTVAEFMLENEALKQFRTESKNKKGKSSIKVKPTLVQVMDLPSLKVAVDMINLAYKEMTEE